MSNNLMFFKLKWEEYALSLPFVIILQILSLPFGLSWLWTCLCRHKQSCYLLLSSFLFCFVFVFVLCFEAGFLCETDLAVLVLELVAQDGLELSEITCLPECWD